MTKYTNKSLLRIGNKYTIDYIIKLYRYKENIKFIVTLGYFGSHVKQYLSLAYPNINFIYVEIDNYCNDGSSLCYSLLSCKEYINEPFIYNCCDTLIDEDFDINFTENTLLVSHSNDSYRYSTIIKKNNKEIYKINNKGSNIFDYIYIGIAYIKNYSFFLNELQNLYNSDKYNQQLSDMNVYQIMIKKDKFNFHLINKYHDMGSIETFNKASEYYKNDYNILIKYDESISFNNNSVIKFFHNSEKNIKRVNRVKYLNNLTPKILGNTDNFYKMELINGKPLSNIYKPKMIYNLLNWAKENLWKSVKNINNQEFSKQCLNFYKDKTYKRVNLCLNNKLGYEYKIINSIKIPSAFNILENINFEELISSVPTYFHGDFILDNILLDNGKFILIDWREEFGNSLEYGDLYYDLAKLRHNIYFNHENINNKLYTIKEINNFKDEIILDMKCNYNLINQLEDYNTFIKENGYNLDKIRIITGLIWLNMAPLHEYPLSNFLFNLGKYTIYKLL